MRCSSDGCRVTSGRRPRTFSADLTGASLAEAEGLQAQIQSALGASYSVERELGGGGMSLVFVATEASLGRRVVVKILPQEMGEGVSVDRFRREIQLAAQLPHHNIAPVLGA